MSELKRLIEQYERILEGAKLSLNDNDCQFTRDRIREYEIIIHALRNAPDIGNPVTEVKGVEIDPVKPVGIEGDNCTNTKCPYYNHKPCPVSDGCGGYQSENKPLGIEELRGMDNEFYSRLSEHGKEFYDKLFASIFGEAEAKEE